MAAGSLECLVHTVAKTALGPSSNSFAFNKDLIRPLNAFPTQPFSAFTAPPYLHLFLLYSVYFTFYFGLFLSSFSLLLFLSTTMQSVPHLTSFPPQCLCHFMSLALSSSHIYSFVCQFSIPLAFILFLFFLSMTTNCGLSMIC